MNTELILLYWRVGQDIFERMGPDGWDAKVVHRAAADLRVEFPESRDYLSAYLRYMRAFVDTWPDPEIYQQVVGKLPWGQNIALLAVKGPAARFWYAQAALNSAA